MEEGEIRDTAAEAYDALGRLKLDDTTESAAPRPKLKPVRLTPIPPSLKLQRHSSLAFGERKQYRPHTLRTDQYRPNYAQDTMADAEPRAREDRGDRGDRADRGYGGGYGGGRGYNNRKRRYRGMPWPPTAMMAHD